MNPLYVMQWRRLALLLNNHSYRCGTLGCSDAVTPESGQGINKGVRQETRNREYPEQDNTVFLFHFDLIVKTAQKYWDQIVWKITKSKDLLYSLCHSYGTGAVNADNRIGIIIGHML